MTSSAANDRASSPEQTTAVANVGFHSVADQNCESSSQAESRSSGKRSSWLSRTTGHDKPSTPDRSRQSMQSDGDSQSAGTGRRSRRSGGFLLDSMFRNRSREEKEGKQDKHGKRKAHDISPLQVDKRRPAQNRMSAESSHGASPLSREMTPIEPESRDGNGQEHGQTQSRDPSLDPAQLVQMALNLSQSRRRHASNTLQLPVPAGQNSARVRSSGAYGRDTVRRRSAAGRRVSQLADEASSDGPSSREASYTPEPQYERDRSEEPVFMAQNCSPATMARVEKAQKYFELANEHRRLLQYLPPLKSDNTAPGNYEYSSKNSPGTTFPQITRTFSYKNSKHELGRAYDPLQAIRNRRQRNRERRSLTYPPERWQDLGAVKGFVDIVEAAAKKPDYRQPEDKVNLPARTDEAGDETQETDDRFKRHRRAGTAGGLNTRPDNEWSIDPSELMADTYWVEQEDNKTVIENKRGAKIFPQRARQSADQLRRSRDMMAEERPSMDSRRSGQSGHSERKQSVGSEERDPEERHSRRRHLLPSALKPGSKLKLIGRSRSPSRSRSSSISDPQGPNHFEHGLFEDYDNTRALDRHMQKLIAEDDEQNQSPTELTSPDHWDSKHTQFPNARARKESRDTKRSSLAVPNGDIEGAAPSHRRSKSADGRVDRPSLSISNPKESLEGCESDGDLSPVAQSFVGMNRPVSNDKPMSPNHKSKIPKFGLFKGTTKDTHNIDRTDFAQVDSDKPREASGGATEPVRMSFESLRPRGPWRTKTDSNVKGKLSRADTESTNDTNDGLAKEGSGVGRFFRGRRIGDIMRGESYRMRSRDRREKNDRSRNVSGETDAEDDRSVRSSLERTNTEQSRLSDDPSPRSSHDRSRKKPQYYMSNLPSFTSPRKQSATPSETAADPIGRQQAAQRKVARPSRFDNLPKINLPDGEDTGTPAPQSDTLLDQRRKSYGFLEEVTSPTAQQNEDDSDQSPGAMPRSNAFAARSKSEKTQSQNRHWSISNSQKPSDPTLHITPRDVARINTLFLSSGIKAHELLQQSLTAPPTPSPFFRTALESCDPENTTDSHPHILVPRSDEALHAARALSKSLSSRLHTYETALSDFRATALPSLTTEQETLRSKVSDTLTVRVHDTSDEADAFTVELTTQQTLRVKQVDDAVDAMFRRRRRHWRWLKKVGFKLLEWGVLGVMWGIWGAVVVVNGVKWLVAGVLAVVRWLVVF
ncbi:hypothetical protein MBLNU230_g2394t1 [Neophaeotheca triangularis]